MPNTVLPPPSQTTPCLIRPARPEDMPAVTAIYGHAVRHTLASMEYDPPSLAEMCARREKIITAGFPYLVAEQGAPLPPAPAQDQAFAAQTGRILGYCYAGPYRDRPGYHRTVENSIYIAPHAQGLGVGRALLRALIDDLAGNTLHKNIHTILAVIGDSQNHASIRLHQALGFTQAGLLKEAGFKKNRYVDAVLMQRHL